MLAASEVCLMLRRPVLSGVRWILKGVAVAVVILGEGVVLKLRWVGVEKGGIQVVFGFVLLSKMVWIARLLGTGVRMPGCHRGIIIFLIGIDTIDMCRGFQLFLTRQ